MQATEGQTSARTEWQGVRETENQVSLSPGVEEGRRQTRPEVEASSLQTCLQGKTWPEGTVGEPEGQKS